jgi:hypothetical protein
MNEKKFQVIPNICIILYLYCTSLKEDEDRYGIPVDSGDLLEFIQAADGLSHNTGLS